MSDYFEMSDFARTFAEIGTPVHPGTGQTAASPPLPVPGSNDSLKPSDSTGDEK